MPKINLAILFGGRSAEHEVSINSARNIVKAADKNKYNITLVGINRKGAWLSVGGSELLSGADISLDESARKRNPVIPYLKKEKCFLKIGKTDERVDAAFPVLHGPFGEDGTIQGLFKLYNVPFVGPGVLGSAVGMDKDVSKRLLKEAGLPIAKFLVFKDHQKDQISFSKIKKQLGLPLFVKPANLGSSVGIGKVKNEKEFYRAIKKAFTFDKKILIEECAKGKEIEVSVLGNEKPIASIPGEIIPTHDFYSYEAKYLDKNGAFMSIPAKISKSLTKKIQDLAVKTFETLCSEGMGRVDFFLAKNNKIFVNEINTIPGFTSSSMYPKLWEQSGISYSELIDKLIQLAIKRHIEEAKLKSVK